MFIQIDLNLIQRKCTTKTSGTSCPVCEYLEHTSKLEKCGTTYSLTTEPDKATKIADMCNNISRICLTCQLDNTK